MPQRTGVLTLSVSVKSGVYPLYRQYWAKIPPALMKSLDRALPRWAAQSQKGTVDMVTQNTSAQGQTPKYSRGHAPNNRHAATTATLLSFEEQTCCYLITMSASASNAGGFGQRCLA
jgi:hypothetical protein